MMKKNGFVFLETIIILMLVTMTLTIMLISYTIISTKVKEKEYYDRVSDKYILHTISQLGTTSSINYSVIADYIATESQGAAVNTVDRLGIMKIDGETDGCLSLCQGTLTKNSDKTFCKIFGNTTNYVTSITTSSYDKEINNIGNCTAVFSNLNLKYIYIINDIEYLLSQDLATEVLDNGTIEYIKTLKKCYNSIYTTTTGDEVVVLDKPNERCSNPIQYMVGVFFRNYDYYYASIEL